MIIDLSLGEASGLYAGLTIERVGGKENLVSSPEEAMNVLVKNLAKQKIDPEEVTLTGAMAIWAYLAVFHYLHGRTKRIYYLDGRGQKILVAAHG